MERSMSLTSGGTAPNPCRRGGSLSLDTGSGGIVAVFSMWNLPPSRHQVQIEPSRFVVSTTTPRNPYSRTGSCAGRTSSDLVIGAKIDRLDVAPGPQIPEVDPMAILVREQILRHDPILELRRQPPLASHHVVARQVPPEVIMQVLGSAGDLPAAQGIERLAVHDEDALRPVDAVLAAAARGD